MKAIADIDKMKVFSRIKRKSGKSIGLVPTMGYFHDGHVSLIRNARKQNDVVVVSVFVNPTQFGANEDYRQYPRDPARDKEIAKREGADIFFCPNKEQMYPSGFSTSVEVEKLTGNLCGISRPGHFKGVSTIVAKLFEITKPDIAYFGQKDAQQAAVIKKMVADLNMDVMIKILPIVRETDGLAMSSRNVYLKKNEREDALILHQSLKKAEDLFAGGERSSRRLVSSIKEMIDSKKTVRVDYVKVVDCETLKAVDQIKDKALMALAVFIGKTRLIDNAFLKVHDE